MYAPEDKPEIVTSDTLYGPSGLDETVAAITARDCKKEITKRKKFLIFNEVEGLS